MISQRVKLIYLLVTFGLILMILFGIMISALSELKDKTKDVGLVLSVVLCGSIMSASFITSGWLLFEHYSDKRKDIMESD